MLERDPRYLSDLLGADTAPVCTLELEPARLTKRRLNAIVHPLSRGQPLYLTSNPIVSHQVEVDR